MSMQVLYPMLGRQYNRILQINNLDGTPAVGIFNSGTVLSAAIWDGQQTAIIFQPTVSWATSTPKVPVQTGYDQGQVFFSIDAIQTMSGIDPAGEYLLLIDTISLGIVSPAIELRVKFLATPGTTVYAPPDLITEEYCEAALSEVALTDTQRDFIPYLINAASQAVRSWCHERYFDLRVDLVDWLDVALDGYVRLTQVPVQSVTRIQAQPQLALTVANLSSGVQTASCYFAHTGFVGGYGVNAWTATGLTLVWVSSGVANTTTLLFATYPTVSQLAAAINAVGFGWQAQSITALNGWLCTELTNGFISQGCTAMDIPGSGAQFNVLVDTQGQLLDPKVGLLWVGVQYQNSNAQRWGPGGYEMFTDSPSANQLGKCKVTYTAGFPVIPADVQIGCAMLVKWNLELFKQELILKSEKAADYAYELNTMMVHAIPATVQEKLGRFRYHYA